MQVCPPRSPYNRDVAGLFGLARMADKARASRCRKNGDYKYGDSSAFDQYLLELIGTEADQFQQAAVANPNDVELAEWVLSHTNINKLALPLYNQQAKSFGLQAHLESDPGKPYFAHFYRENFDKRREIVSSGDTTVQNWLDLMDYDDQKSFGIIDLARRPPRSPYNRDLGGIVYLARLIDKGRAFNSQTLGEYWYGRNSGNDLQLLRFLNIPVDEFTEQLQKLPTDQEVLEWVMKQATINEEQIAEFNKRAFIALGLDESKAKFVLGSEFQLEKEYVLDVLKMARITTVNRARRSMDEVSRRKEDPMVSQMIYPLMQALDIAHLGVDLAVGGTDQRKIHMLARENLPRLGYKAPVCLHTPILLGLDGQKMSSSKGNYISVRDSAEEVERKIRKAYCPAQQVEDNPIIQIVQYHIIPRFGELKVERDEKYGGDVTYNSLDELLSDYKSGKLHPLDLKRAVAKYLNKILENVREKL